MQVQKLSNCNLRGVMLPAVLLALAKMGTSLRTRRMQEKTSRQVGDGWGYKFNSSWRTSVVTVRKMLHRSFASAETQ